MSEAYFGPDWTARKNFPFTTLVLENLRLEDVYCKESLEEGKQYFAVLSGENVEGELIFPIAEKNFNELKDCDWKVPLSRLYGKLELKFGQ